MPPKMSPIFQEWLTVVQEHASPDVIVMILGNKADMNSERVVKSEQIERLAKVIYLNTGLNLSNIGSNWCQNKESV